MEMRTVYDEKNKLWKGEDVPPLYNPEISLGQVLLKALTIFGPKIAQVITYVSICILNKNIVMSICI